MIESSNRSATNTSLCDQCLGMMHIHCICDSRRGGRHDASCLGVSSRVRVTIELRRLYRLCLVHLTTRVIKIHRLRSFSLPETRNHLCRKANEQNEGCWERKRGERKKVPYLSFDSPWKQTPCYVALFALGSIVLCGHQIIQAPYMSHAYQLTLFEFWLLQTF